MSGRQLYTVCLYHPAVQRRYFEKGYFEEAEIMKTYITFVRSLGFFLEVEWQILTGSLSPPSPLTYLTSHLPYLSSPSPLTSLTSHLPQLPYLPHLSPPANTCILK